MSKEFNLRAFGKGLWVIGLTELAFSMIAGDFNISDSIAETARLSGGVTTILGALIYVPYIANGKSR